MLLCYGGRELLLGSGCPNRNCISRVPSQAGGSCDWVLANTMWAEMKNMPITSPLVLSIFSLGFLCLSSGMLSAKTTLEDTFFRWQWLPQPGSLSNPVEQSTWLTHPLRLYMSEKETSSMLPLTFQHIPVVTGVSITLTNRLLCKGGRQLLKWLLNDWSRLLGAHAPWVWAGARTCL